MMLINQQQQQQPQQIKQTLTTKIYKSFISIGTPTTTTRAAMIEHELESS